MKKINLHFMAMLLLFAGACGQGPRPESADYSAADSSVADVAPEGANVDTAIAQGAKLVKTAEMQLKVRDVEKSRQDIYKITSEMNGMVTHQSTQSDLQDSETMPISSDSMLVVSSYKISSNMVVRVPSEKLEDFMNLAGKSAVFIDHRSVDIDDKSLDYLAAKLRNQNRAEWAKNQKTNTTAANRAKLEVSNEAVEETIANKRIDLDVAYSTIVLMLYQSDIVVKERKVNTDLSNYRSSFWSRLGYALSKGWSIFTDFIIGLANAWVFLLVIAVIIFIIRYYQKTNKKA